MARRQVSMNEIVEMVYQWHQGRSIQGIERSFGTDRKTIRKYVRLAQAIGVCRGTPLPEAADLIGRMKALGDGRMLRKPPRTPARDLILPHRQWIEEKLRDSRMTAKQVWRLLREEKGVQTGYCTVKRYLRAEFQFGAPPVTVRLEVEPGSQAQVDLGMGMMVDL
jgi:transposase